MDRREFLKFASFALAAAGIAEYEIVADQVWLPNYSDPRATTWDPLNDDGAAFRLMVDAGINVRRDGHFVWAYKKGVSSKDCDIVWQDKDIATRKAIFDCAVAIGRGEP